MERVGSVGKAWSTGVTGLSSRAKPHRGEDKATGLDIARMRLPSWAALRGRGRNSEHGQVGVHEVLLACPGAEADDDRAKVARACLDALVDFRLHDVHVDLEPRSVIARAVGLAEARADARQDAEHDNPLRLGNDGVEEHNCPRAGGAEGKGR